MNVGGHGDLLDLFPVWLDASEFLVQEQDGMEFGIRIRHEGDGMARRCSPTWKAGAATPI